MNQGNRDRLNKIKMEYGGDIYRATTNRDDLDFLFELIEKQSRLLHDANEIVEGIFDEDDVIAQAAAWSSEYHGGDY